VEPMKKIIICIAVLGLLFGAGYLYLNSYVKYVPVVLPHDDADYHLVMAPKLNTAKHRENLKVVLEHECVNYKVINGDIYIKRKVTMDKTAVFNLTRNANDSEYVKISKAENIQWNKK
jgi:hypothetical protein